MHKLLRSLDLKLLLLIVKLKQQLKSTDEGWIHYIGGSEALPPPLDMDDEITWISKLNEVGSNARSVLIERNLRLVVYIARKFENTGVGVEDLVSIGTIGLIKAVNTFDPDKKIKLATYASRCI